MTSVLPSAPDPSVEDADREILIELSRTSSGQVRVQTRPGVATDDPALGLIVGELQQLAEVLGRIIGEVEQGGRMRKTISVKRRRPVTRALEHVADLLVTSALDSEITEAELESRVQVTTDAVDFVLAGDSSRFESLIGGGPTVARDLDALDVERAAARGRLRLQALYRRLIRDSYTVKDLSVRRLSRSYLNQLRGADRLFAVAVPHHKGLLHPRWQFDEGARPRSEMPELIAAARSAGLDAISFHQLMVNPRATDEGAPLELLDEGRVEEVLEILRAGGA